MADKNATEEQFKYKYIKLAMTLYPLIPLIKKKIDSADKKFVEMGACDLLKDTEYENNISVDSTLRLVMFAYDIIMSASNDSGKRVFVFRNRISAKDKIPKYWRRSVRNLRRLMKCDIWKTNVEQYNNRVRAILIQNGDS